PLLHRQSTPLYQLPQYHHHRHRPLGRPQLRYPLLLLTKIVSSALQQHRPEIYPKLLLAQRRPCRALPTTTITTKPIDQL
ncbi:hypothetical protein EC957_007537, partial [Mortierella hygrophila]